MDGGAGTNRGPTGEKRSSLGAEEAGATGRDEGGQQQRPEEPLSDVTLLSRREMVSILSHRCKKPLATLLNIICFSAFGSSPCMMILPIQVASEGRLCYMIHPLMTTCLSCQCLQCLQERVLPILPNGKQSEFYQPNSLQE